MEYCSQKRPRKHRTAPPIYGPKLSSFSFPLFRWGYNTILDAINTTSIKENQEVSGGKPEDIKPLPSHYSPEDPVIMGGDYSLPVLNQEGQPTGLFVDISEIETAFTTLRRKMEEDEVAAATIIKRMQSFIGNAQSRYKRPINYHPARGKNCSYRQQPNYFQGGSGGDAEISKNSESSSTHRRN